MKVRIRGLKGEYEIPDVSGIERGDSVTTLKMRGGRDTLFIASKDIVEVDSK
jgi:hypothetical protein